MSDSIVDFIDKEKVIAERLTIDNKIFENMTFTQGINKLGLDKKNLIIIDGLDNNKNYLKGILFYYLENFLPIKFWMGDQQDDSLLKIRRILGNLRYAEDVRVMLRTMINVENPI